MYVEPGALSYPDGGGPRLGMMFTPGIIAGDTEEFAMLMFDPATGDAPVFTIWNAEAETWATQSLDEYRGRSFTPMIPVWDASGAPNSRFSGDDDAWDLPDEPDRHGPLG